jgi:hypothetical protein
VLCHTSTHAPVLFSPTHDILEAEQGTRTDNMGKDEDEESDYDSELDFSCYWLSVTGSAILALARLSLNTPRFSHLIHIYSFTPS